MAFFLHRAHALTALFPELYRLIKAERKTLKPQTPQTIIVGNLDVESWLEEKFVEKDGVLMGVHFPFLETALETFADRMAHSLFPGAHESYFTPPGSGMRSAKKAGILQLELVILNFLAAPKNAEAAAALGYDISALGPLQLLTLAQKLAGEIREYLLHAPQLMEKFLRGKPTEPLGQFWKLLHSKLKDAGYTSGMLLLSPKEKERGPSLFGPETAAGRGALYLFGMPVLSAYHIRKLCTVALTVDVHLMTTHSGEVKDSTNLYYAAVAEKYRAYTAFIEKAAHESGAKFVAVNSETELAPWQKAWLSGKKSAQNTESPIRFLGLPGAWRGAELLADLWHEAMRGDAALRQDDFAAILTKPAEQFIAFERACGARQISAFARNRLFEAPHPVVELVAIFSEATGDGIDRELVVRYLSNRIVRERFRLDPEKTARFIRALTEANGFRNDYPEALDVFNLKAAIDRIRLGLLVDPNAALAAELPGAAYTRRLDSAEALCDFLECIGMLMDAVTSLRPQHGADLMQKLTAVLQKFQNEPGAGFSTVTEILAEIAVLMARRNVTLQQTARILSRHTTGQSLSQGTQRRGVCFSPFAAPAFLQRRIALFDLNEELDAAQDNDDRFLPEYLASPTRLSKSEQAAIHLTHAALSGVDELQICYSHTDPETGAEKYRSVEIEKFKASLVEKGITFTEQETFAATIFDTASGTGAANAADAEVKTLRLVHTPPRTDTSLSAVFIPKPPEDEALPELRIRDLLAHMQKPLHEILSRRTILPEVPPDFRYAEPKLAESKGARFRFAENYLLQALLSPDSAAPPDPVAVLSSQKRRGIAEPEGFDFMHRLLNANENARILGDFAAAEKNRLNVVEYFFDARVSAAFTVEDGARLKRCYLPAPRVAGTFLTGSAGKFVTAQDDPYLFLPGSAIYEDRTASLITAYLYLSLLRIADKPPAGIRVLQYEITEADETAPPQLAIRTVTKIGLDAAKISDAEGYLTGLVKSVAARNPVYFDAALIGKNNLGGFAAKSDEEILGTLVKEREKNPGEDFVPQFYAAELNGDSVSFFNDFIRPIAVADATSDKPARKKKS